MLYLSRLLQRVSIFLSPLMRSVLAGSLHSMMSSNLMLVSFTGRSSGRVYTTPVSYVRDGDDLLVPGGGRWWKNLNAGTVRVRLQGVWRKVTPEVISEREAMAAALGRMIRARRAVSVFTGIGRGADGNPAAESLDRERNRGFVIVRLHLAEESQPAL